jgi:ubiquinol-cytochrome c reductase cytochrome c1 subunit
MKSVSFIRTLSIIAAAALLPSAVQALGEARHPHPPVIEKDGQVVQKGWPFDGFRGHYDKQALQRGFKVYREVCAACHALDFLSFRTLGQAGGPFDVEGCYGQNPEYPDLKTRDPVLNKCVKALAAEFQVPAEPDEFGSTVDEQGNPLMRPAKPSDPIPGPYQNDKQAAAANNGKVPPDLSLITEARHDGANYVYSLLTGYPETLPQGLKPPTGLYYNPYFPGDVSVGWEGDKKDVPPGGFIAMAPPIVTDGQVSFDDGTEATLQQMSYDVVNFLQWAAEPKMEARKQTGLAVMAYLAVMAVLLYWSYRRVWRNVEH